MAFSSNTRINRLQANSMCTPSVGAGIAAKTSGHGIAAALALAPVTLSFHKLNSRVPAPTSAGFLCKERVGHCWQPSGFHRARNAGLRTAAISATPAPLEADRMTLSASVASKQPDLAESLAREIERLPVGIAQHPIFGAHDSPQMAALLVRSLEHSTSCFPSYLAFAAAHAPNDEIRSTVISQLNEELGNGRWVEDGHANLLKTMANGLRRELGELVPQDVLTAPGSPAHSLKKAFDQGFLNPDSLRMLGTFMVAEALAKHFDIALLEAIKRHMANGSLHLSADELRWIRLHAELEVQHEGEVLEMCRALKQLDARAVERVRAGAEEFLNGFRAFLDGMCQEFGHLIGQKN